MRIQIRQISSWTDLQVLIAVKIVFFFLNEDFSKRKGNAAEKSGGHKSATVTLQNGCEIQPINFGLPAFFSWTFKEFPNKIRIKIQYLEAPPRSVFVNYLWCFDLWILKLLCVLKALLSITGQIVAPPLHFLHNWCNQMILLQQLLFVDLILAKWLPLKQFDVGCWLLTKWLPLLILTLNLMCIFN